MCDACVLLTCICTTEIHILPVLTQNVKRSVAIQNFMISKTKAKWSICFILFKRIVGHGKFVYICILMKLSTSDRDMLTSMFLKNYFLLFLNIKIHINKNWKITTAGESISEKCVQQAYSLLDLLKASAVFRHVSSCLLGHRHTSAMVTQYFGKKTRLLVIFSILSLQDK